MILVIIIAMLSTLLVVVLPPLAAQAAGTVLFDNTFKNRTVNGTGTVNKPTPTSGTNGACLTATGNSATLPLLSCSSTGDPQGSGKLRLTNNGTYLIGGVIGGASFPTSNGLDVTFNSYQWGGGGADGMSFVLAAVDPANPAAATTIGPGGGSLGYSPAGSIKGLPNAYLGVGLDVFGNFSGTGFQGSGCTNAPNITTQQPGSVVVRGPGNNLVGYCGLATTYNGTAASRLALRAGTRAASVVPVQVLINPTSSAFTSDSGQSVAAGTYKVIIDPVTGSAKVLSGQLPSVASNLYPSPTWLDNGVPKQLSFGFVGSTGSVTDAHEIDNVKVLTFNPVPQLGVSTVSYAAGTSAPGDPVSYVVSANVLPGANENSPISVTQTVPTGVKAVGAYGAGWDCAAPILQTVTCTTRASNFTQGTSLPVINVVAIVTATGVTASTIQNSSTVRASSADANPGTDTKASPGTRPAAGSVSSITPATASIAGGETVTINGTSPVPPTAIEIGTTAEQQAGTPVVLLPCEGSATTDCFRLSGNAIVIPSMPGRAAAAAVTVTVVTLGVAVTGAYVYAEKPSAIAAPTATAGLTSATLAWVVPDDNGSGLTGYVVTPYLAGVAQTARNFDAAASTRVINGLTAGGNYTFRVTAVNAFGTSAASPLSNAVTPYSTATAPAITSVRAATSSVVLNWTAATSNGGSAVTGYVVTPYIGTVAQTPQTFVGTGLTQTVTGLTPGTAYTFTVAATLLLGTNTFYRINAGGPMVAATDGGGDWSADTAADSPLRNSGSLTSSDGGTVALDATVPTGTPVALFATQRYDPGSKGNADEMKWTLPVTSGTKVKVRLYFANRYTGTSNVGDRLFDVAIDDTTVLSNFDAVAGAGADQTATMREFPVTSDGIINIDFTHEVENPIISAIEVYQSGLPSVGPASARSTAASPNQAPTLTFAAPPAGQVNVSYSTTLTVTNGTSPFVWSVSSGTLPAGITLNASSGLLSGTPTAGGSFPVTIRVVDASGLAATKAVTLVIAAAPTVTFAPAAGEITVPYSQQPTVTGGTGADEWSITGGSIPAGLAINATTGLISGTPTVSGSFSVTVSVKDDFNQVASRTVTIVIAALPTITSPAPVTGQVGLAYSTTFTVAGGTAPLVWSVAAGNVPSGLSLSSSTGELSGTPTTTGSTSLTVLVTDAFGKTTTKAVTLVVNAGPIVMTKTADKSSAAPGDTVKYTIAITNNSSTAFTGVNLSDPLAGVLDDAAYNADAIASTGALTYTTSTLGWTGTVGADATVTITYSVKVNNPDVGNKVLSNTIASSTVGTNCPSGSLSPLCTSTVTVAGLSIVHSAGDPTTTPGSTVAFSIIVTNTGQSPYAGATFTENLSAMLDDAVYNGATTTSGSVSYASPTLSWTGNLAVGASATITYSLTVADPDTGNRSLAGTVVSPTAGSSCPSGNPSASCTATVTVLIPALAITNTAGVSTATPGSTVPYTVTLRNTGQTAYTGTSVTVALAGALDDATDNANAVASAGTVVFDAGTGTLIWTGNLAIGATVTITASVTVRDPDPGNRVLTTVASSSAPGSTCPTGSASPACTSTVAVLIPALTITKSTNVSTTTPGSVLTYTLLVTNTGQTAYTGASLSDNLTEVLDDAAYGNNAAATSGTVTYSGGNVGWTGSLAIGASATITYSVTVDNPDNGNRSLTSRVTSATQGSNCTSGSADIRCVSTVAVLIPGLTITASADVATTTPGSQVRYTTTVQNTGGTTHNGVEIRIDFDRLLDDATNDGVAAVSTGTLAPAPNNQAVWTLSLNPGQTATLSSLFTVRSPDPGDKQMVASASSNAPGSTCPTGSAKPSCSVTVPVLIPGLTIIKTADKATVVTGDAVGYTISVTNTGQTTYPAASFSDSLANVLTDATYAVDAAATSGTVSYASSTLSWTGALAPGASTTITYSIRVRDPDPGDKRMTNTVVSSSPGSNCAATSTDPRCTVVVDVLVPGLTITKTADATTTVPGGSVGFTVKVVNTGSTPQTGASFSDALTGVLDDATYSGGATTTTGSLDYGSSTLTWTGDLAVAASATISYSTTVNAEAGGDNRLNNTAISTTRGSNCASGSTDPRCTVSVPVARLLLVRSVPQATTTPGSVVQFPVTFTNTGQVPYVGISVTMPRADSSDDVYATEEIVPSSGSIIRTEDASVWTGSIPVGGVVTIPFNRTAYDPPTGNRHIRATLVSEAPGNNCPPTGGSDPRCSMDIEVLVPGLSITKSASTNTVAPGGSVGYTVTITNTGQTSYSSAVVSDSLAGVLDDAAYNADAAASSGSVSYGGSTLTWSGSLAAGAVATISYSVTAADPGTGDKNMVSRVSSTDAGSSCRPSSGNAGCVSSVTVLTPALTIVTSADTATTTLGATVTYTVSVSNTGQTSYPAAGFSDSLAGVVDDAAYLPAATTSSRGEVSYADGVLSWTGALAVGQSATITYAVSVNNPATGNLALTHQVSSTTVGSNCPVGGSDSRCRTQVEVLNSVALSIVKTANVASTVPGGVVVFTLRLTNPTDTTIFGATVTDSLTSILDDATYTSSTASVGVVGFSNPNVTWTGNVAARRTVTVTYTVTVGSTGAGDELLTATTVSTSPPTSNNCLPGSTDPHCTTTVPVARLDLVQTTDRTTATPGSVILVTAVYTNTGQVPYTGISVSSPRADTSDDTIPTGDQVASSGALLRTADSITWTGDIPVGGIVTTTRTLRVKNPDPGDQVVKATVNSAAPGNNCQTGTIDARCSFTVAVVTPKLTLTKTADVGTVVQGGTVSYTIRVSNNGQTPYSAATDTAATVTDALNGILDDASYGGDATTTVGSVSYADSTLSWTGDLAVGQVAIITYSAALDRPGPGDKVMTNTVVSPNVGSSCPPASGNPACRSTVAVLTPALTIVKTADKSNVNLGATVTYTVKVTNTGQTSYAGAQFDDSLTGVLDDATYNAGSTTTTSGTLGYTSGVLSWSGALSPGASATITYSSTANEPTTGDLMMTSTITSTTTGSNCALTSTDSRCTALVTVTNAFDLTFVKTSDVETAVAGETVTYSVAVTNASESDLPEVKFSDPLGSILDDATYNENALASDGTVSFDDATLTWTGTLVAGATVTVTYSVTVRTDLTGDEILSGRVSSPSSPASNNCLPTSTDVRCTNTVTVSSLLIQQSYAAPTTTPGSTITLSATFTNTGQTPYEGITIVSPSADTVDDAFPVGDQTATAGTLVLSASAITWTGNIPVGGTVTVTGTLVVKDPTEGDRVITGTLVTAAPGSNCPAGGSDLRCTARTKVLIPGLTITKAADDEVSSVAPGGSVGYTVRILNNGETPYVAASVSDSLVGVLDDAVYNADAVASTGTLSYASPNLSWTGDLAVGAEVTISYSVTASDPGTGDKNMVNRVSSTDVGSSCPPASGNTGCVSSVDVLTRALTIVKSANTATTTLGATVTYTVSVSNNGQVPYPAAGFSDSLTGVIDDASYLPAVTTSSRGDVSYADGVLSWTGALAVGQSATITYAVSVNNPSTGDRILASTVTSNSGGSNCAVGSADSRCSTRVDVLNSVALSIVKTANVASTVPGGVVVFTLRLTNPTGVNIIGANITDSLTGILDDASYTSSTANVGAVAFTNSNVTWTGNVAARRTVTVTYTVTVGTAGAGDDLLTATSVSTSPTTSNNCLLGSTDRDCTTTVPVARLDISQTPDRSTATPGSLVAVTGTFVNTGQVPYTGISISLATADVIDDATPEGDAASAGGFVRTTGGLTWTGDIPVGATITTTRLLRVKSPDPGNQVLSATQLSDAPGNNCAPPGTSDPRCTFTVTVLTPRLTISTRANATFVVPAGVVGYTITINNNGQTPYSAVTGTRATVTDALAGVLDDATYNGDATTTAGSVSFGDPNLTWTGDLDIGSVATINFSVTAHRPADGDKAMISRVSSNNAGTTCVPNSSNVDCSSTVDVRSQILTTAVTASKATAMPGDTVTYTVTATNPGQTDYTTATFSAPLAGLLDDADYGNDASASSGSVVRSGDALVWTGPLVQGAQATITYSVTIKKPLPVSGLPGNHRLEQTITSIRNGSNCLAGSADPRCVTSVPIASLQILNHADVATTKPTGVVNYTVTFTNTGQVPYVDSTLNYDLVGAVDDAVYNGDATADVGTVTVFVGFGRVSWTGDIAIGQTITITGSVTVMNPDPGDRILTTTVIASDAPASNCAPGSTDVNCVSKVTVLAPALTISKVASTTTTTPGGTVGYTITATNTGETAYTAAEVSDDLAAVLADSTYSGGAAASRGRVQVVNQKLTWTGDLGVGEEVTITYGVVVNDPDLGDKLMVNRVTSDELGSTCPTGGSGSACTSTVAVLVPALDITITASSTTTTPGSPVGYTLTVTNTGQTAYVAAEVKASLTGALDNATYADDATASTGSLGYLDSALTWTGDLAVGSTAVITYSLIVNAPVTGNQVMTTAVSTSQPGSTCTAGAPCLNTVTILIPGFAVTTTADAVTVTPGDQVTFTIRLENTGQTAYTQTSVSTSLGAVLDDATFDGAVIASAGAASYATGNLTWIGNLAVGADPVLITYQVRVKDSGLGDKVMTTTVLSPAEGSTCPAESTTAACTATVTVLVPGLSITKTANATLDTPGGTLTTTPGSVVAYTISITNSGETPYRAATVFDSLAEVLPHAALNSGAGVVGGGQLSYDAPTLSWTGDLEVGATATITYSVTVDELPTGDKLLVNQVVSTERGSSCPSGSTTPACRVEVRVLTPALQMTKTADKSIVVAGDDVTYTVTLTNTGETDYAPATFTDSLTKVLDDATYAGIATASTGTITSINDTLAWTGALNQGESAVITYSVRTNDPAGGDQVLSNQVLSASAGTNCSANSTDPTCRSAVTVLVPALSIIKTADVTTVVAGGTVTYTILATNTGEADYSAATVTDSLADVLDDATYDGNATASSGALAYASGSLTWTGDLAVGENVLISYSIITSIPSAGDASLVNLVSSNAVGSTCPGSGSNPSCVSTVPVQALVVELSDLTPSFTLTGLPGATVQQDGAVGMTVTTNSSGGYVVTVQATEAVLSPTNTSSNTDSIPIGNLGVRRPYPELTYEPLSKSPFVVYMKNSPSGPAGDAVSNDYQIEIPFVAADTYSTTLEYIVTTQ